MAQPEKPVPLEQEHVLTASGEFDVHDAPIDIGIYRLEEWIAFVFFLGSLGRDLSAVLHALRAERLSIVDGRNCTLPADLHNVHRRCDRR